ncbi:hypothetical protein [Streptomyces sp. NPDC088794]|uniref:hypothetical protein n=1 Tax=Streptomyces sp. NPDC088794 TaxID=3365902 RepID=UPI00380934C4
MPVSDPYQVHNYTVLSTIMIAGVAALLGLAVYLGSRLTGQNLRAYSPPTVWRDLSLLTATTSLALYLWGCLHIVFLERQEVGNECAKKAGGIRVAAFHGDFVPLQLVCRTDADRSFTVVIPDYINPSIAVLLLSALACGITSILLHRKRHSATCEQRTAIRKQHTAIQKEG